jgi:hypothetical protein
MRAFWCAGSSRKSTAVLQTIKCKSNRGLAHVQVRLAFCPVKAHGASRSTGSKRNRLVVHHGLGLAPVGPCSGLIIGVLASSSRSWGLGSGGLLVLVHRLPDAPPLRQSTSCSRPVRQRDIATVQSSLRRLHGSNSTLTGRPHDGVLAGAALLVKRLGHRRQAQRLEFLDRRIRQHKPPRSRWRRAHSRA